MGRPLSLVRCPEGASKSCFFQKHLTDTMPECSSGIAIKEKGATATYIAIDDLAGLISLVQMGVLEIHPWGCREDRLERPDRLVIDIDPRPTLPGAMSFGERDTSGSGSVILASTALHGPRAARAFMWWFRWSGV